MPPTINRRTAVKRLAAGLLQAPAFAALARRSLAAPSEQPAPARPASPWLGLHLELTHDDAVAALTKQLPALADLGLNTLVVEVDYSFEFTSHPELRTESFVTRDAARRLAAECRRHPIRLIPQLNCLGHQSWAAHTAPLLTRYPEFDETPGQFPGNKGIYCRSWCPLHPKVNEVVLALVDELIDGFESDAFHVGMDEVFLVASEFCPRCKGKDPADLFATAVNDLHGHVAGRRHVEMLMWGDRLLDGNATGYGKWEASENGTAAAIDRVPKDVVVCDWHYGKRDDYPSVALFLEKGLRVWPCGWDKAEATDALIDCELRHRAGHDGRMLGHLCSTWGKVHIDRMPEWPPVKTAAKRWAARR